MDRHALLRAEVLAAHPDKSADALMPLLYTKKGKPRKRSGSLPTPIQSRLADKIAPEPNSGCWLWVGYVAPSGYGSFGSKIAHRAVYESMVGPIPAGLVLDHKCRVRCCVNPDHLEPVTQRENLHRSENHVGGNARKTHCWRGHPLAGANLIVTRKGFRQCRDCSNIRTAAYNKRRRAHA